jgi:hypothetical protein
LPRYVPHVVRAQTDRNVRGVVGGDLAGYLDARRDPVRRRRNEHVGTLRDDRRNRDVVVILAAILVIAGIVALFRGAVLAGAVLIIVGLLVGPGGASIFK